MCSVPLVTQWSMNHIFCKIFQCFTPVQWMIWGEAQSSQPERNRRGTQDKSQSCWHGLKQTIFWTYMENTLRMHLNGISSSAAACLVILGTLYWWYHHPDNDIDHNFSYSRSKICLNQNFLLAKIFWTKIVFGSSMFLHGNVLNPQFF